MPVRIRGKIYPCVANAAMRLGVHPSTIYAAIKIGTEDNVGLGYNRTVKRDDSPRCKPITIGNVKFPSIKAAAASLGYDRTHFSIALRRGTAKQQQNILRRVMLYEQAQAKLKDRPNETL